MLVVVILTSTSVGFSILGSSTFYTLTSRGPLYTSAFMLVLLYALPYRERPCPGVPPGGYPDRAEGNVLSPLSRQKWSKVCRLAISITPGVTLNAMPARGVFGSARFSFELRRVMRCWPWHPKLLSRDLSSSCSATNP